MSSWESSACPICFEVAGDHWSTQKAWYHREHNHSWDNWTCDGHGICWSCLARHIETQVLSEGRSSIRCPGAGCRYLLLRRDVEHAMWGSRASSEVLSRHADLGSQLCQGRLREMVLGATPDASAEWLLGECQPCPQCFVFARREDGCDHIVCRCGCDFCFGCGAPCWDGPCLCGRLHPESRQGQVFFAAWLRTSCRSPRAWLREGDAEGGPSGFIRTLGFWLWIAGAEIPVEVPDGRGTALCPLRWLQPGEDGCGWLPDDEDGDGEAYHWDDADAEEAATGKWQDLAGHLRKEAYSTQSQRSLRRGLARKELQRAASAGKRAPRGRPTANRTLH